jgi:hypothetical protein
MSRLIEEEEVEQILNGCSKIRKLINAMQPALKAIEEWLGDIEMQGSVWEWRLRMYPKEEESDD